MFMDNPDNVLPLKVEKPAEAKTRVVVFGSFYRGYSILSHLLNDKELMKRIEIVGVATDDPSKPWVSGKKRVWQYPHSDEEETMVERLAERNGIPVFKGKVKSPEFYRIYQEQWKPDITYMGTFGQLLDKTIIETPKMGIFNCHPADGDKWPSCVGPDPFEQLFIAKKDYCAIALHATNDRFDDGDLACFSERIPVPYDDMQGMQLGERVIHMHKLTSPFAGQLVDAHLRSMIDMPLSKDLAYYQNKFSHVDALAAEAAAPKAASGASR